MRKTLYFIFIICFLSLSIKGEEITRDDVISTASQYVPISGWTPVVDSTKAVTPTWHSWYKTKANGGNPPYDRLAYCWGGFDSPWLFNDRVERENNPLPAGGKGTEKYGYCRDYIAGVDCSGLVENCWGIVMLQFKIKGEERISRINKNRKWRLA